MEVHRCLFCQDYFHKKYINRIAANKFFQTVVYICDFCSLNKEFRHCDSCSQVYYAMNVSYSPSEDCMICDDCNIAFGYDTLKSQNIREKERKHTISAFKDLEVGDLDGTGS